MNYNNFTLVTNPLVKREITILRDKNTCVRDFRRSLNRLAFHLAVAVSENLELDEIFVETPLEVTNGVKIKNSIVLIPVLRAGLSMVSSFIELMPNAKVGHIGLQRDEETLLPIEYYYKTPKNLEEAKVFILDPMLATGGSASAAFDFIKKRGAKDLYFVSIISAPEGIENLQKNHPEVIIYSTSIDRGLNENGYIVPGLGDAGDRTFGTL
jgi:uracil phosphoribosyltransferase